MWTVSCGKPVFSSPSLLPLGGEVVLGCVDGCVYIIDSEGEKVHLRNVREQCYALTIYLSLEGPIHYVQLIFLQVKQLKTGQPVFSSCSVAQLCDRDTQTLQVSISPSPESSRQKTQTQRDGKDEYVEKEECGLAVNEVKESNIRVFSGSHDKCVYCWSGRDGEQVWKTALDSEVYSTPIACNLLLQTASESISQEKMDTELEAPADITKSSKLLHSSDTTSPPNWSPTECDVTSAASSTLPCVCACSTSGHVYLLDAQKGDILGSMRLPGEVFSSPAVVENLILVGCRDDNVYCIECAPK